MSLPNKEKFHHYLTYGSSYDPEGNNCYDPAWFLRLLAAAPPVAEPQVPSDSVNGEVIELKVPFCCEKCVDKVIKKLNVLEGVGSVICNYTAHKVTVSGTAKPAKVLEEVKKITHIKGAELLKPKAKK